MTAKTLAVIVKAKHVVLCTKELQLSWLEREIYTYLYHPIFIYLGTIGNVLRDNDPSGFMFITYNPNCYYERLILSTSYCQHYANMNFGALHNHSTKVTRSDTPSGFKPHL